MHPVIVFCAEYVIFLVVLGWILTLLRIRREQRSQFIICTIIAIGLAGLFALLASHLHYEPRPFVSQHKVPLVSHGTDNGFPSDHALVTMTLTVTVWFFKRRLAICMLIATVLVGLGRIAALLHSPQQILAGWVIGLVSAVAAYEISQTLRKRRHRE